MSHSLSCTILVQNITNALTWAELERQLEQVQASFEKQELTHAEAATCAQAAWQRSKAIPEGDSSWEF